jgi:hypothetical protein
MENENAMGWVNVHIILFQTWAPLIHRIGKDTGI